MNSRIRHLVLSRFSAIVRELQPGLRDLAIVAGKVLIRRAAERLTGRQ